ncbi:MAG TPA: hypothetical protein VHC70_06770 [Phycisphaerales bacterium]|nr:hypothetical protein [Phycisphaerales bacterium]
MIENDEEGAEMFRESMAQLNDFLASIGLPAHHEPADCPVMSWSGMGYSTIHFLRRLAAHVELRGALPAPLEDGASKDGVLQEYYELLSRPGWSFSRLIGRSAKARAFEHVINHSDAEGYYLPHDFERVLNPPDSFGIAGGMIGSSVRLKSECVRLAEALGLPLDVEPEQVETLITREVMANPAERWQAYPAESYMCATLLRAADHSIKHGAAIVFC